MVTDPPALGRQAAMLGDGTSANVNELAWRAEALVADAGVRPTETARAPAIAVLPRPAAVQARVRRLRFLILRMRGSPYRDAASWRRRRAGAHAGRPVAGRCQAGVRSAERPGFNGISVIFWARCGPLRYGCSAGCGHAPRRHRSGTNRSA